MPFAVEDELEEPLLGRSSQGAKTYEPSTSLSDDDGAKGKRQHGSMAVVPHSINRVDWEALWRVLWSKCCRSWSSVLGLVACALPLHACTLSSALPCTLSCKRS